MERGFQAMLMEGEGSGTFSPEFLNQAGDDDCINAVYEAMNNASPSFLNFTDEKYLLQTLDYGSGTFSVAPAVDPVTFGFLSEDSGDRKQKSINFVSVKDEPLSNEDQVEDLSTETFDFISKNLDSKFRQLPNLRSLEVQDDFAFAESSRKRVKSFSEMATDPRLLESMVSNFQFSNYFAGLKLPEIQAPATRPPSVLARQRRQKISDKTRCLQKLLPWDKKMDQATMLEEAYKYVKFLQAQISVLQSMPCDCSSFCSQNPNNVNVFGGLGKLSRQQLLQVLVNSPVAQTLLYSQGCCVYSIEQLVQLKKIADQRKAVYQQMVFHSPNLH